MQDYSQLDKIELNRPKTEVLSPAKATFLFLGILIISGVFWAVQQNWGETMSLTPQIYEFEADVTPEAVPRLEVSSIGQVKELIKAKTRSAQGTYGWYVASLTADQVYGELMQTAFTAASVNKIPIMVKFLLDVEQGNQDLAEIYKLKETDIEEGSGSLQYQKLGTPFTFEELVLMTGKESDNTALNALVRELTRSRVQSWVNTRQMTQTNIKDNITSPEDMGKLLADIYRDEVFSQTKHKDLFFEALTDTEFEDRIPKGVPEGTRVIHKIGNQVQVWNDCGIVMASSPYVLCILTDGVRMSEAEEILPYISKIVWTLETGRESN